MRPKRFDGTVGTAPTRQFHDFGHHVAVAEIERHIRTHHLGNTQAVIIAIDRNDGGGPQQARPGGGTQANRPLRKDDHGITDLDIGVFRSLETGGHDVRTHQHLLVRQPVGNRRQVGLCIRHQHVFRLGAVDQVAEAPAGSCLVTVAGTLPAWDQIAAILRRKTILRRITVEIGTDRTSDDPLSFLVALNSAAQFLDHANRFVPHGQTGNDRIFALQDMYVGPADGGGRDPDQRIIRSDIRDFLVRQFDSARGDKNGCLHHAHVRLLLALHQVT